MEDKTYYRTIAKTQRKELDIKKISSKLCDILSKTDEYINAKDVLIYYPLKYEISLLELLSDDKQFYLPKVFNEDLQVCPYSEDLMVSSLGIKEPCNNPVTAERLDLIIVPALMVDKENYRLGYGGGYYDRFLTRYPHIKSVTLISEKFCVEKLPHDVFDVPVDIVIAV